MPPRLRPFLHSKGEATGGIRIANANACEDEDDATGAVCLEVGGAGTSGDSGKRREKSEVGGDVGAAGRAAAPVKGKRTTISIQLELLAGKDTIAGICAPTARAKKVWQRMSDQDSSLRWGSHHTKS